MSTAVLYRIDFPDGDLAAAMAVALRLAKGSNAEHCSGTVVTESADHASALVSLRPDVLSVTSQVFVDPNATDYTVKLSDVDDAVIAALLATADRAVFSLCWTCSRYWHQAFVGEITLYYNCSTSTGVWWLEPGKLVIGILAFLDHGPEADSRAIFAELGGIASDRVQRGNPSR